MRGRTARAAGWAFVATAGTRLVTLLSLVIVARLLSPADFGLLAFALVYITYAETIGDLGTSAALIYWKDRREDAAQVTFVVNLVMGVLWCALTLLLAPAIAGFFNNPEAAPIIGTLAFSFPIKYAGNTHDALAQKDLRFRARAVPELGMALTKAGVSIALAVAGFGPWSLVWGQLAGQLVWTVLAWSVVSWRPRISLVPGLAAPMLRYGRGIIGVNIISAVVHHADLAVVGRLLGTTALGLYQVAYKVPEATIIVLTWVISRVLFPAFSRLESIAELRRSYFQALRYVSFITVPLAAGLFLTAEPLLTVVFGEQWRGAGNILRWLAIYAGIRSISTPSGDVLKASGHSSMLARIALLKAAIVVPALILGARYGVEGVAIALAASTALTFVIQLFIVRSVLGFELLGVARAVGPSALAGAVMIVATLALQRLTPGIAPHTGLVATIVAGAVAYATALLLIDRPLVGEIIAVLPRRQRSGQA
jgi:O-antigen/teichoic acid export membrane protein